MKAIMMSIRPQHVANILNGIKTLEIRKKFPSDYVGWVYIYCTKDTKQMLIRYINTKRFDIKEKQPFKENYNGKVVARFWCDKVEEIICRPICGEWECYTKTLGYSEIAKVSCLENREIVHYLKGKNGCAIHITNLEIFDKPKEISEFHKYCDKHFSWWKNKCLDCKAYTPDADIEDYCNKNKLALTKAPQSFCFIEV